MSSAPPLSLLSDDVEHPSGEDVRRALIGWPKCPDCGAWMECRWYASEPQHRNPDGGWTGKVAYWSCRHDYYVVRFNYYSAPEWDRWHHTGTRSEIDAPQPLLSAREVLEKATPGVDGLVPQSSVPIRLSSSLAGSAG